MCLRWYGLNQYEFKIEDEIVTFFVYMDDLRLYTKKLIMYKKVFFKSAKNFSDEIRMAFGFNKCVKTTIKRRKLANKAVKLNLGTDVKEIATRGNV